MSSEPTYDPRPGADPSDRRHPEVPVAQSVTTPQNAPASAPARLDRDELAAVIFAAADVRAGYDGHTMTLTEARWYPTHASDVTTAYRQADAVLLLTQNGPSPR